MEKCRRYGQCPFEFLAAQVEWDKIEIERMWQSIEETTGTGGSEKIYAAIAARRIDIAQVEKLMQEYEACSLCEHVYP